jgi:hypothetical protein
VRKLTGVEVSELRTTLRLLVECLMVKADKGSKLYTQGMKQRKFKLSAEAVQQFEKRKRETREAQAMKRFGYTGAAWK